MNKIVNSRYREQFPILARLIHASPAQMDRQIPMAIVRLSLVLVKLDEIARQKDTVGRIGTEPDTMGSG